MSSVCSVVNCGLSIHAKNYCNKHYRRYLKVGIEGVSDLQARSCKWCKKKFQFNQSSGGKKTFCSEECKQKSYQSQVSICEVEQCESKATSNRMKLCAKHRSRKYKHGDTSTILKLAKYPEGTVCKVEGCQSTKVLANYMCNKHYTMWKKHGDPKGGKFEQKIRKAETHSDGTRTCSECEQRLPIKEFHKDKNASDGYRSKCKKCRIHLIQKWYFKDVSTRRKVASERRKRDPEKARKDDQDRYVRDREKRIALAVEHSHLRKARKKKTKTVRGISKLSLRKKLGTKCYYCGKEMDFSVGEGRKFNRDMATIEHLVPLARGGEHTFENTVLACRFCNISKNAKTEAEFDVFRRMYFPRI